MPPVVPPTIVIMLVASRLSDSVKADLRDVAATARGLGLRGWLVALIAAIVVAFITGIPTAVVPSPIFGRSVEVRQQDYAFWAVSSVLLGFVFATFLAAPADRAKTPAFAGGFLSYVAVGCPTCNKLAVVLLGTSGALNLFGPLQFFIGVASVGLLLWTVVLRARALNRPCPLPLVPAVVDALPS